MRIYTLTWSSAVMVAARSVWAIAFVRPVDTGRGRPAAAPCAKYVPKFGTSRMSRNRWRASSVCSRL